MFSSHTIYTKIITLKHSTCFMIKKQTKYQKDVQFAVMDNEPE